MKRLLGVVGGLMALTLPALGQAAPAVAGERLITAAYAQDRDHDRDDDRDDRDRDRNWNADRDREWHRHHRDRDRDRDWDRARNRDRDGDWDHDRDWDRGRDDAWHRNSGYRNVLAPEWQRKYDSYYQRWLRYRATNNQSEMRSMEKRMDSIRTNYRIPPNVPYGEVVSNSGRY